MCPLGCLVLGQTHQLHDVSARYGKCDSECCVQIRAGELHRGDAEHTQLTAAGQETHMVPRPAHRHLKQKVMGHPIMGHMLLLAASLELRLRILAVFRQPRLSNLARVSTSDSSVSPKRMQAGSLSLSPSTWNVLNRVSRLEEGSRPASINVV